MAATSERIHKFHSRDLKIRGSVVVTTGVVREMCSIQHTFPAASVALGRALTGALLLASQLRDGQRIGILFNGDGPLGSLFTEATFEGEARGYCSNPQAEVPLRDGKLDIAGAVGRGTLNVTRSQPFQKAPHVGIVPIATGEIGEDLAHYLYQSHQVPSIIALTVQLDNDGKVAAAGGVLIELMPEAGEKVIAALEAKARMAAPLSRLIQEGKPPRALVEAYSHTGDLIEAPHPHAISYTCRCSPERVDRTLQLLGKAALAEMILKGEAVPVTCQFCGRQYTVQIAELRKLSQTLA